MKLNNTLIEGVFVIENFNADDNRGSFIKTVNEDEFIKNGLSCDFREQYYSISNKDVVRGMHFQLPPCNHAKLVHVIKGKVLDVILDIRKESKTYGKAISIELNSEERKSVYIPSGCAHGFKSLEDDTVMLYNVTTVYNKDADCGILWDSLDFDWDVENPIISARDLSFERLEDFNSPF